MSVADLVKLLQEENNDPRVRLIPFDISEIKMEERVRLKCMIPPCPNYGRSKFCPPNLPDLDFLRKAVSGYKGGALIIMTIPYTSQVMEDIKNDKPQNELMRLVGKFEKIACEKINHLSFGLNVGGCRLCDECVSPEEPCRKPLEAHPGITGFGIDITTLARKLGVKVEWPVKNELNFMGMLFI